MLIENVRLDDIAEAVGTPCYVYSQASLEEGLKAYHEGFADLNHSICYSVKANSNIAVLALMARLGAGFDIVSGGELMRVLKAGGDAGQTVFSGTGKSADEIRLALKHGVRAINLESECELLRVQAIAEELDKTASIGFRVNPDIDPRTHPHIATGLRETKFGVAPDAARELYLQADAMSHVEVSGIAVHIGSQIIELDPFLEALHAVVDLAFSLQDDGIYVQHIDLGGGLGVRYRDEHPPTPAEYGAAIARSLGARKLDMPVFIEPGRSITAQAGTLLTRVEYVKRSPRKNFAIVDAAMNDLIRPALYGAWMEISEADASSDQPEETYDVVGPVCESGDFLGKDRRLRIAAGDLLVVRDAGAYGAVMSSNYNSRPKTAEVLVHGDRFEVIRTRESIEDMLREERIPAHLQS